MAVIPHRFPFAFIDPRAAERRGGDHVAIRVSAGDWLNRVGGPSPVLSLELLAQASLILLPRPEYDSEDAPAAEGRDQPAIAGFADVHFDQRWVRRPPAAGDTFLAEARLEGRFGPMLKVKAALSLDGEELTRGTLLLVGG